MHPLEADEPAVIGPYRLLGRLGSGGMGRVYLGRSTGGRTVAVKIVHPHFALDEEFRARFRREVDAARRVGGDWTAPVLEADPEASVPWVATAYAAGPSLTEAVRDGGALPEHSVRVLGAGLAEALAHVHGLGLVHRDVKPSNVLLTMDGPRLIDFGIARATDGTASLTSTGVSIGSPGYMSPEQILGKGVTGAADVFSLGAVLVYAATAGTPFPGDSSAALLYKVVHAEPELGSLTGDFHDLVAACLAKDPADRPAPAALARHLAPEGAASLVAAGWLPGPVVERVSRSAVRLLDLEVDHTGGADGGNGSGAAPVPLSGPVPFTGAAGVFGPPDASYGAQGGAGPYGGVAPARTDAGAPAAAPVDGAVGGGSFGAPANAAPANATPSNAAANAPANAAPSDAPPTGGLSLSVAATSAPVSPDGRGRRVSCTVALAVAGALAAVTVGSVFVFNLLPGDGGGAKDSAGRQPSATGDAGETGATGVVPVRYLGEWRGKASAREGLVPLGTFDVTVRQVPRAGQRIGAVTQTDLVGDKCVDILTLKSASPKELVATGVGAKDNPDQCSQASHTVRLRPVGSELQYTSEDPKAGDPAARLAKVK
ncbi:serine/threonine-protein kinase [Streptomyces flavofungini]|uniref:Serine/threonine protein kinase n=1 Tax=Streptomyces flavofungini TaxID=68200 RepID=A0ABS0XH32_9ACTN|nr:serine/threonine-protein kinase [Streptomyces flavofungini]MBJ3812286.1 serine/threonine protein kinase [Streptomyces flavofungini]GHC70949.1 serine/threonine protein kinase [Streptomyces flavofungini]